MTLEGDFNIGVEKEVVVADARQPGHQGARCHAVHRRSLKRHEVRVVLVVEGRYVVCSVWWFLVFLSVLLT